MPTSSSKKPPPTQSEPPAQPRPRLLFGPLLAIAAWLLAAAYLGGIELLVPFVLIVSGVLLPIAALMADGMRDSGLSDELRVCAGGAIALLIAIPAYYLRRTFPFPSILFDAVAVAAAFGAALGTGALRRYVRAALSPSFLAAGWLLAGVVPAITCLVWMGFEVRHGEAVRYYGLFTVDFSNLASITAMIKCSSGLPQFMTAGGGPLHYHWWFFTIAAWLSGFAGFGGRSSSALALSNLLTAVLLAATICAVITEHLRTREGAPPERLRRRLATASTAIVIVAPLSVYAYQLLVAHVHRPWFTLGTRNSLLLSIINSMSTFGNNSLALVLVLVVGAALAAHDRQPSWKLAALIGLADFGIFGLSVTLTLPLMLAAGAWILMGKVRQPWRLAVVALVIGAAGLPLLRATNIIGGSSQHLKLSFDRGQFIQNIALGMAPIWVLAAAALLVRRRLSFSWLLVAACVLVPTFIDVVGRGTVSSSMSMKVASLLVVAAAPLVADGIFALISASSSVLQTMLRPIAALVLLLGLGNSLAYTLQFAVYRLTGRDGGRSSELPADYVQALDYVRRHTEPSAVVVDPNGDRLRDTISTSLIAERQVWLPTQYSAELVHYDNDSAEIMSRSDLWRAWEKGHFTNDSLAAIIADGADILVGPPHIQSTWWKERHAAGQYTVYTSRRRR